MSFQTLQQLQSGKLKGSKHIQLSCALTQLPQQIFDLADTLEILDLSNNQLSYLPSSFGELKKLKILFASDNLFTEVPEVLAQCPNLEMIGFKNNQIKTFSEKALPIQTRWLILTNNQLTSIPQSIGKCYKMQKLALAGNQLKTLPQELSHCKNLGLLRISANQLQTFPEWLLQMPKLSWLAFAGNPFCYKPSIQNALQEIDWADLLLQEQLGQGASGIINKAIWKPKNQETKEVAVKVFKGAVTSDGLPEDEMNACILAGSHNNLVKVIGKVINHPEQKKALVLALIPANYYNLGLPPSYATCTRDVFKEETVFSIEAIIKIVLAASSVAAQLHNKGILHGDLYAHNILVNNEADSLLGDFGAASLFNINDANTAKGLQQIEVSAWGCLLDDLLSKLNPSEKNNPKLKLLLTLRDAAMNENCNTRPSFEEILNTLS